MNVVSKGNGQSDWSKEYKCTGCGNGGGGCGAILLVSQNDIYETRCSYYDGSSDEFDTFSCCECGVATDISCRIALKDVESIQKIRIME